ncbi:MAG: hypothetical protein J6D27_04440 [Ruminiclostridium sp.]|nr:hypothetical protein [Ruminiclostridium sp.]
MENEFLNEREEIDEKELLQKRREEQIERVKKQYQTDAKEKEEAMIRMKEQEELEKSLGGLYSARKFCGAICIFMWIFAAFSMLTGTMEMKLFLPMCLYALCALAAVNAPIFMKKKKMLDGIIAIIAAVICFGVATLILTMA